MAKKFKPPKGKIKVPPKVEEGDETSALQWINENIWKKAKKGFGSFPYTTDLFAAYYCLTDTSNSAPLTPRLAAISAIIYFIWPFGCYSRHHFRNRLRRRWRSFCRSHHKLARSYDRQALQSSNKED